MSDQYLNVLFVSRNLNEIKQFDKIIQNENLNYRTEFADNFKSGLQILTSKKIKYVISDHVLSDGMANNFLKYDQNLRMIYLISGKISRFDYTQVNHLQERYVNKDPYGNFLVFLPSLIEQFEYLEKHWIGSIDSEETVKQNEVPDSFSSVPGLLLVNKSLHIESVNETFKNIFNIQDDVVKQKLPEAWQCLLTKFIDEGIKNFEGLIAWNRSEQDSFVKIHFIELTDGENKNYIFLVWDRTVLKVAEIARDYSEERYKLLIENFPEGMALKQYNRFYYMNRFGKQILGLNVDDKFPGIIADGIIPETSIANKIHGTEAEKIEYWIDINGKLKEIFVRVIPVQFFDQDAQLVVFRDVEESRQYQNKLAQLAAVVEQATDSIIITDLQGHMLYVNPAFERVSKYNRSDVLGKNPRILKSGKHPESFYREMWETISSGKIWSGKIINKNKNGEYFVEDVTIFPVKDSTGETMNYAAVKKDITAEKMLQEELVQSQKLEAIGQLAGGVAHDFNNMLTAISGFAELGLLQTEENSKLHRNLNEIYKAAERASTLTRQLLAFSRKQEIKPKNIKVNDVLEDLTNMLRRLIDEHIEFQLKPGQNLPDIHADKGQLEQMFVNLVVNARDAIRENPDFEGHHKIVIETSFVNLDDTFTATHLGSRTGPHIQINVSDTGKGIPPAIINKIFDPFFTTKKAGAGTGLGLSTVYGIVKQNDGSIFVYSEVLKGTSFKIFWPVVNNAHSNDKDSQEERQFLNGHEKILVVEDDENVRTFVEDSLKTLGYEVETATNGREALTIFKNKADEFDLIFTDIVMPKMTGKELSEQIKKLKPRTKFLFASGYTAGYFSKSNILEPGIEFIQKPYSLQDVAQKIRRVLEKG